VLRSRAPIFIEDAQSCERDVRKFAAQEYGVQSICYIPVLGGVLEYGTSEGDRAMPRSTHSPFGRASQPALQAADWPRIGRGWPRPGAALMGPSLPPRGPVSIWPTC
tara:strand:- start:1486 stop:1806 length:321 start_codon:yes stop_codon:yes gene_type:complete